MAIEYKPEPKKHSGLGIASFIISIISGLLELVCVIIAGVMQSKTPGGIDETSIGASLVGLGIIGGVLLAFIGFALGVAGLFQKGRNIIFTILGIIGNLSTAFIIIILMLIGLTMKR